MTSSKRIGQGKFQLSTEICKNDHLFLAEYLMDGIEEATGELIAGLKAVSNILNKPKKKILQENMDKKSIYGSMMSINKAGQEQRQAMRHNRQARASVRQRIASNLTRETSKCQDKLNGLPVRKRSISGAEDDPLKIDIKLDDDVISMKERVYFTYLTF